MPSLEDLKVYSREESVQLSLHQLHQSLAASENCSLLNILCPLPLSLSLPRN